jgi:hypothetical protein
LRTWDYFKQIYPEDIAVEKGSLFISDVQPHFPEDG